MTNKLRQKKFHQKMQDQGFHRTVVYVPEARVAELRIIAATMRDKAVDPNINKTMRDALEVAKGALSASVDQNTKDEALETVNEALANVSEEEEPI